jgi:hypothetical protein
LALKQDARALRKALTVDLGDTKALRVVTAYIAAAVNCIGDVYEGDFSKKTRMIEKMVVNTKDRFSAYAKFNSAMSGSNWVSPKGNTCEK